jgi:predicted DCC family thiol-disulfide oxidoreductase YuxK
VKGLLRRLHDHWFAPAPLEDLALVRIVVVSAQLILLLTPYLSDEIGACLGCSLQYQHFLTQVDQSYFAPIPTLRLLLLPFGGPGVRPDPMFLHAVWVAAVLTGVTGLIGAYTRPSLLVFAASNTLLVAHSYSYGEFHHPEALMTIALWTIALGPSGAKRSVDELLFRLRFARTAMRFDPRPRDPTMSDMARWPLRLIQWMFGLIYFSAGISKLANGGLRWFNGYTLAYDVASDGLDRGSSLGVWMSRQIFALRLLSVFTIVFELAFWVVLLLPGLTLLFVLSGIAVHVGIYATQRAPFPQLVVLYIVFIEQLRRQVPGWDRIAQPKRDWTVVYDGLCPLCIRSMVILDYLDLRGRLVFVDLEREWARAHAQAPGLTPEAARHAMHVVGPDGRVYRGFFGFRALTAVLPPLWVLFPLAHLPLADRAGGWIYDRVARSRGRELCRAETCTI